MSGFREQGQPYVAAAVRLFLSLSASKAVPSLYTQGCFASPASRFVLVRNDWQKGEEEFESEGGHLRPADQSTIIFIMIMTISDLAGGDQELVLARPGTDRLLNFERGLPRCIR